MMEFCKITSRILLIPPAITLSYDFVHGWFVKNVLRLRKLSDWWNDVSPGTLSPVKNFIGGITEPAFATKIFDLPAPVALAIPAVFFYLLYRIIFLLQGGKTGGGYVYKSRH
jgi:hypothetical protein